MVNADNSNDYREYSYDACKLKHGFSEERAKTDVEAIPPEERRREGNPRDAADWTDTLSEPLFAGRGFTGHEHLEEFALINMNSRIYDPMLGRFFSPDPYVQLPGYAGSYNRYSYCLNNQLMYVDPTGYSWLSNFCDWLTKIGRAVITTVVLIYVTAVIPAVLVSTGGATGVATAFSGRDRFARFVNREFRLCASHCPNT